MSVDLPEPETPVTHANSPNGRSTSKPLRLCCRAPTSLIDEVHLRRDFGTGIDLRPLRYSRVKDRVARASRALVSASRRNKLSPNFPPDGDDALRKVRDGGTRALPIFPPSRARKSPSAPFHTNSPPCSPRPGPRSIKLSAERM